MKTIHSFVAFMVACAGCTSTRYINAHTPEISTTLLQNTAIARGNYSPEEIDGDRTILKLEQSQFVDFLTTQHSDFDIFYIVLPADVSEGQTYQASKKDGTLWYDGFSGYGSWFLERDELCVGKVTIVDIQKHWVAADLDLVACVRHISHGRITNERKRVIAQGRFFFCPSKKD